jgi:hypothetical protein
MQQARLILRRWWTGFALLILTGMLSHLFFSPYGSAWHLYQQRPRHYVFILGHAALFGVMIAATYLNQKALWWVAIVIISLKLYRLLKYYLLVDYFIMSIHYNQDYMMVFYRLQYISHLLWIPGQLLFGNDAVSAAFLTTLYVYWLVQCRRLLHAPAVKK